MSVCVSPSSPLLYILLRIDLWDMTSLKKLINLICLSHISKEEEICCVRAKIRISSDDQNTKYRWHMYGKTNTRIQNYHNRTKLMIQTGNASDV